MLTSRTPLGRSALTLMAIAGLIALAACAQPSGPVVQGVLTGVEAGEAQGLFSTGEPTSDAGAPIASVSGPNLIVPGGSAIFTVSASDPFTAVYLSIAGMTGFVEVPVAETTSQDVVLSFATVLDELQYDFNFAVGTGAGAGPAVTHTAFVESVGTGDLQVSVSWDVSSDVDLQVLDPNGERIYWGHRESTTGGILDLDANSLCTGEDKRNENITWEGSAPPTGVYEVILNYYSACGQSQTKYVVTVRMAGQAPQIFEGTFTGDGFGFSETDRLITTFNYPPAD